MYGFHISAGLREGSIVTCTLIESSPALDSITVAANTKSDFEMLDASSYRIASTVLDQTSIVTRGQNLVIWINTALSIQARVLETSPNMPYGRLCQNTRINVPNFVDRSKSTPNMGEQVANGAGRQVQHLSTAQLEERARDAMPTRRLLDTDANLKHLHNSTINLEMDLKMNLQPNEWFRVIAGTWEPHAQLYDVYTNVHNWPDHLDAKQIFELYGFTHLFRPIQCFVNVRLLAEDEIFPDGCHRTLEASELLLRTIDTTELVHMRLTERARAPCQLLERIDLQPAKSLAGYEAMHAIEQDFKKWTVERLAASGRPVLFNQGELFRLVGDRYVTVRLVPEELKYACVDEASMRRCRVVCKETVKEMLPLVLPPQQKPTMAKMAEQHQAQRLAEEGPDGQRPYVRMEKFEAMIDRLVAYITCVMALKGPKQWFNERINLVISGELIVMSIYAERSTKRTIIRRAYRQGQVGQDEAVPAHSRGPGGEAASLFHVDYRLSHAQGQKGMWGSMRSVALGSNLNYTASFVRVCVCVHVTHLHMFATGVTIWR